MFNKWYINGNKSTKFGYLFIGFLYYNNWRDQHVKLNLLYFTAIKPKRNWPFSLIRSCDLWSVLCMCDVHVYSLSCIWYHISSIFDFGLFFSLRVYHLVFFFHFSMRLYTTRKLHALCLSWIHDNSKPNTIQQRRVKAPDAYQLSLIILTLGFCMCI